MTATDERFSLDRVVLFEKIKGIWEFNTLIMKYTFVLLVILFVAGQLSAQQDIDRYLKANRMKRTGRSLTFGGGVLAIVGISLLSSAKYTTTTNAYGYTQTSTTDPQASTGALVLLGGIGCLGAGIPIWAVGAHRAKKHEPKAVSLNLNVAPTGVGLALRF